MSFLGWIKGEKPTSKVSTNKNNQSKTNTSGSPQTSGFSEETLSSLKQELEKAYQKIIDANWKISPFVCPPEIPLTEIATPDDIIKLCRMSEKAAYDYFFEYYDRFGQMSFYQRKIAVVLGLFSYKRLGAQIPEAISRHIDYAVGHWQPDDAVDIIKQYRLWGYNPNRNYYKVESAATTQPVSRPAVPAQQRPLNSNGEKTAPQTVWKHTTEKLLDEYGDSVVPIVDQVLPLRSLDYTMAEIEKMRKDMISELIMRVDNHLYYSLNQKQMDEIDDMLNHGKQPTEVFREFQMKTGIDEIGSITKIVQDFSKEYQSGKLIPALEKKRGKPYKHPLPNEIYVGIMLNEKCPCNSGKKFKYCHYIPARNNNHIPRFPMNSAK